MKCFLFSRLEESIQQGGLEAKTGAVAPSSLLEVCPTLCILCSDVTQLLMPTSTSLQTGKAFTTKGMQVLEYVGKETMDLLITETGIDVEKNRNNAEQEDDVDQLFEEVTFDRCFYIYGGPEQLEVCFLFFLLIFGLCNHRTVSVIILLRFSGTGGIVQPLCTAVQ